MSGTRRVCKHCGATIERASIGWVDVMSGGDGVTYDVCPRAVYHAPDALPPAPIEHDMTDAEYEAEVLNREG